MGNPHALVEVEDVARAPVAAQAAALQGSGLFPQGVNVGFAQLLSRRAIRLRVVERGVGETLACGSGACAAVAVLVKQGKLDRAGGRAPARRHPDDRVARRRRPDPHGRAGRLRVRRRVRLSRHNAGTPA